MRISGVRVLAGTFSLLAFLLFSAVPAYCSNRTVLYFFWSTGCPHCKAEKAFLDKLLLKYPALEVKSFEVKGNRENAQIFSRMAEAYGVKFKGVPATFIGEHDPVVGFDSDETSGREIENSVANCIEYGCPDPLDRLNKPSSRLLQPQEDFSAAEEGICAEEVECPDEEPGKKKPAAEQTIASGGGKVPEADRNEEPLPSKGRNMVTLPFFGEIDTERTALPYLTIIIGGLDAFNPCAFFVLFTLLGLLIHVQSRKKLFLVGGIFVFFSGFIYFIFMAAWLNIFLLTGQIAAVTMAAGIIALVIAVINIKDFFFFKKGISLVIPERAKPKLFDRMRKLLKETSLPAVILGTVVLAVAANSYELFCTAGFPMVYTRILTLHDLSKAEYYLYIALYNIIYVIPLAIIVLMFAITLGAKKLTEWQGQVLKLISGMMMLCLGAVLLFRPDLLNNILVTAGLLAASLALSSVMIFVTKRFMKEGTGRM